MSAIHISALLATLLPAAAPAGVASRTFVPQAVAEHFISTALVAPRAPSASAHLDVASLQDGASSEPGAGSDATAVRAAVRSKDAGADPDTSVNQTAQHYGSELTPSVPRHALRPPPQHSSQLISRGLSYGQANVSTRAPPFGKHHGKGRRLNVDALAAQARGSPVSRAASTPPGATGASEGKANRRSSSQSARPANGAADASARPWSTLAAIADRDAGNATDDSRVSPAYGAHARSASASSRESHVGAAILAVVLGCFVLVFALTATARRNADRRAPRALCAPRAPSAPSSPRTLRPTGLLRWVHPLLREWLAARSALSPRTSSLGAIADLQTPLVSAVAAHAANAQAPYSRPHLSPSLARSCRNSAVPNNASPPSPNTAEPNSELQSQPASGTQTPLVLTWEAALRSRARSLTNERHTDVDDGPVMHAASARLPASPVDGAEHLSAQRLERRSAGV